MTGIPDSPQPACASCARLREELRAQSVLMVRQVGRMQAKIGELRTEVKHQTERHQAVLSGYRYVARLLGIDTSGDVEPGDVHAAIAQLTRERDEARRAFERAVDDQEMDDAREASEVAALRASVEQLTRERDGYKLEIARANAIANDARAESARLRGAVEAVLSKAGCFCECDCDVDGHGEDCEMCVSCRVEAALSPAPETPLGAAPLTSSVLACAVAPERDPDVTPSPWDPRASRREP